MYQINQITPLLFNLFNLQIAEISKRATELKQEVEDYRINRLEKVEQYVIDLKRKAEELESIQEVVKSFYRRAAPQQSSQRGGPEVSSCWKLTVWIRLPSSTVMNKLLSKMEVICNFLLCAQMKLAVFSALHC